MNDLIRVPLEERTITEPTIDNGYIIRRDTDPATEQWFSNPFELQ